MKKSPTLQELSGGFGTLLCFVHDWTPPDLARKSYDLLARHVMPHTQGLLRRLETSAERCQRTRRS